MEFAKYLEGYGFTPVFFPTIEVIEPDSWDELDEKISRIDEYSDLIFTSVNAVRFFIRRFEKFFPIERMKGKKFHAVGVKTKNEIEKYGFQVEELPEKSDKENLFKKIFKDFKPGRKFLFPHGNLTDEGFVKFLKDKGLDIEDVVVYKTIKPEISDGMKAEIKRMLEDGEIKVITFFSPSSVANFFEIFEGIDLKKQKIAVIGETTLKECKRFGLNVDINPIEYNAKPDSKFLADLINRFFNESKL
jgi:uroporphyrinogen III methyltransferase/synthase